MTGEQPTTEAVHADAVIFDMDGTIVDSTEVVEHVWGRVAERHDLSLDEVLAYSHGRRSRDTFTHFLPEGADIDAAVAELEETELRITEGTKEIPGARALIDSLGEAPWGVVTSAPRALALARIAAAGLPEPRVLVAAEDTPVGKPDPSGYLLGAERLGVEPGRCVVFEDADAGVRAAVASGATTVVVGAYRSALTEGLRAVPDLRGVAVSAASGASAFVIRM
ncbi:HAD-IA family hydrolase [Demequina sp. NBRC 110054]|uniref:HAD-IA family hydrolase n=1 Tax=Demequina sp. NBRC 110054 TaxID=1570343 RepID=UPI0009FF8EB4|nr:HAD-IA family hydrolase [Demequina sp. NBRC 110054]